MRATLNRLMVALILADGCLLACTGWHAQANAADTLVRAAGSGAIPQPALVGIWRVVRFCDADQSGRETEPLGAPPIGYFIYSPSGELSIQVMRTPAMPRFAVDTSPTDAELRTLHQSYFGYFGSYTVTSDSTVIHHVIGGTFPEYIGTEQPRSYRIWGANRDSLSIGGAHARACRLLVRVA
jgi:lipocalin-like protein